MSKEAVTFVVVMVLGVVAETVGTGGWGGAMGICPVSFGSKLSV